MQTAASSSTPDDIGPDVAAALSFREARGAERPDLPEILAASTISLPDGQPTITVG